ncbi:NTP transferase domain-containing protein [Candidatus Lokiarchaeum ossiferum]|uniref:NTP transferase domain-containing protein n=1 Tax=Candidatus Lokiarchaeum ossiferum TaxID=2951803 RepID=UPI00352DD1AC
MDKLKIESIMKCLILAAGYGSRLASFLKNLPKPLYPLNSHGDTCLSLMLDGLVRSKCSDIHIVGGHQIEEIRDFQKTLEEEKQISFNLIDATNYYHRGPLFSFLTAENALNSQKYFAVFPGDTVFHPIVYQYLEKLNFSAFEFNSIHLFYCKSSNFSSWGNICLKINNLGSNSYVEAFNPLSAGSNFKNKGGGPMNIMIPILILPGTIFLQIKSIMHPSNTTLFHVLQTICMKSLLKIIPHQISEISCPFKDFDLIEDLSLIQSIIEK